MKKFLIPILAVAMVACGEPEARKPIKAKTSTFMQESVERSKKILADEEAKMQTIIQADSLHQYQNSATGSWFYYNAKSETEGYTPQPDDLVTLTYDVRSLDQDTIYSFSEIGRLQYKVDQQELFPGLRNSVKLLQEGESATFLFPSSLAYGYHGDDKKIGHNVPIMSTITILEIQKNTDSIQP